jgi:hypothetical protein
MRSPPLRLLLDSNIVGLDIVGVGTLAGPSEFSDPTRVFIHSASFDHTFVKETTYYDIHFGTLVFCFVILSLILDFYALLIDCTHCSFYLSPADFTMDQFW